MSFHTTDAYGVTHVTPDSARMQIILQSAADSEDAEFPDVSLIHANGHCLCFTAEGHLIWELPDSMRRVRLKCPIDEALVCWKILSRGDLDALSCVCWDREEEG